MRHGSHIESMEPVRASPHFERRLALLGATFTGQTFGLDPRARALATDTVSDDALATRAPGPIAGRIGQALGGLVEALRRRRARERAERELHGLDDRLLRDIGLERGDISRLVAAMYAPGVTDVRAEGARSRAEVIAMRAPARSDEVRRLPRAA